MAQEKILRLVTSSFIFIFQMYLREKIKTYVIGIVLLLVQLTLLCKIIKQIHSFEMYFKTERKTIAYLICSMFYKHKGVIDLNVY